MSTSGNPLSPKHVQVLGLQRSGTNFLTEILKNGQSAYKIVETGEKLFFWKHALPEDKHQYNKQFSTPVQTVLESPDLSVIFISKHPYWWLSSILKRNPADLQRYRPQIFDDGFINPLKAIDLWAHYYRVWSEVLKEKFINVQYEKLLSDTPTELQKIQSFLRCPINFNSSLDELKVPYSKGTFSEKKSLYSSGTFDLDTDLLLHIQKSLPSKTRDFIQAMGYKLAT